MTLAGLAVGTQKIYIQPVRVAAHYRRSPDQLSEEEVRTYLPDLCQRGAWRIQDRAVRSAFPLSPHAWPHLAVVRGKKGSPRTAEAAA
jgi:hypothetical protein